jgi:hypothetical protein
LKTNKAEAKSKPGAAKIQDFHGFFASFEKQSIPKDSKLQPSHPDSTDRLVLKRGNAL